MPIDVTSPWWWLSSNEDPTLDIALVVPRAAIDLSEARHESIHDTWGDRYPHTARAIVAQAAQGDITAQIVVGIAGVTDAEDAYDRVRAVWMSLARVWLRAPSGRVCMPVAITRLTRQIADVDPRATVTFHVVQQGDAR